MTRDPQLRDVCIVNSAVGRERAGVRGLLDAIILALSRCSEGKRYLGKQSLGRYFIK